MGKLLAHHVQRNTASYEPVPDLAMAQAVSARTPFPNAWGFLGRGATYPMPSAMCQSAVLMAKPTTSSLGDRLDGQLANICTRS